MYIVHMPNINMPDIVHSCAVCIWTYDSDGSYRWLHLYAVVNFVLETMHGFGGFFSS